MSFSLTGTDAKSQFALVADQREQIESNIGEELDWEEMPNRKESRISVWLTADPLNRADWERQHTWLAERLEAFFRVLSPRVKAMGATDYNVGRVQRGAS